MLIQENEVQQVSNAMMNMFREGELEIINKFYEALKAKEIDESDALFKELVAELESNFLSEEEMMTQSEYADTQMHINDHNVMRKKLAKFQKRWDVLKSTKEVLGFLEKDFKKWYTQHISKWDAQAALNIG